MACVVRVSVNGKILFLLPPLGRSHPTVQISGDLLPGGEPPLCCFGFHLPKPRTILTILAPHRPLAKQSCHAKRCATKLPLPGWNVHYAETGHLVYQTFEGLGATPFDLKSRQLTGDSVSVFERERVDFTLSQNGTLAYFPQTDDSHSRFSLVWVDRLGREEVVTTENRVYRNPRISPDGSQVALTVLGNDGSNVWIYTFATDSFERFTFEGQQNRWPAWTPDGRWITFAAARDHRGGLYRKAAGGGQSSELVLSLMRQYAGFKGFDVGFASWSPDGRFLAFSNGDDIGLLPRDTPEQPRLLFSDRRVQISPVVSPDSNWIAYVSNETGRQKVFVRRFDPSPEKWLISGDKEGLQPLWSPDGRELFYRDISGFVMAVPIATESGFRAGKPRVLLTGNYSMRFPQASYDISPDGERFLMIKQEGGRKGRSEIRVILNWFEELERLVPAEP